MRRPAASAKPCDHGSEVVDMARAYQLRSLHRSFGVEVQGVDLERVDLANWGETLVELWRSHGLLLFRDQELSAARQCALGALLGANNTHLARDGVAYLS